jgi:hypothetical protein
MRSTGLPQVRQSSAAVAAEQRIGSRLAAVRAVELGGRLGIGHVAIITPRDVPMWAIREKWENRP